MPRKRPPKKNVRPRKMPDAKSENRTAAAIVKSKRGGYRPSRWKERDWANDLIELMGATGCSLATAAKKLGTTSATFMTWQRTRDGFKEACADAQTAAQAWWEEQGRGMISDPAVSTANVTAFIFMMCNRWPKNYQRSDHTLSVRQEFKTLNYTVKAQNMAKELTDEQIDKLEQVGQIITIDETAGRGEIRTRKALAESLQQDGLADC